jgi:predicted TIM-barrel fold metal-dependent hydrolase
VTPDAVGGQRTLMSHETWRRGYALLEQHGLHFDLQTPWWNLDEAIRLARDFPRTLVILNHAGLPADRSAQGLADWHAAMARFSEEPNVRVKISGLGQRGRPCSVEDNRWIVEEIIAMFGAHRAMFASNFPVDSLCASFDTIYSGFKRIAARYSQADQAHPLLRDRPQRLPHHGALSFRCRRLMRFSLRDPEEVEMIASRRRSDRLVCPDNITH